MKFLKLFNHNEYLNVDDDQNPVVKKIHTNNRVFVKFQWILYKTNSIVSYDSSLPVPEHWSFGP